MSHAVPARPGRGRRADPDIEPRVLSTTIEVYAEVGWAGFTMDMVARRSGVGKAALYRRWPTKEKLILAALASRLRKEPKFFDTGSLRGDLLLVATMMLEEYFGSEGLLQVRAMIEAKLYPDLFGHAVEDLDRQGTQVGREIVLRAVERGELPRDTSPALILDAVAGTIIHHVLMTPVARLPELKANSANYAERVVDFVLSAAGYEPDADHRPAEGGGADGTGG
ncbi:TetR/AcrR family transcriptional regulator [Streptomyces sp. NPDC046909]|uniref:TetR/AcrR family transcriptional regulator n=1 Tax=Streptomyces sp. NPDC046909 TaxID=3155617 RepID=UPI00340B7F7B